MSKKTKIVLGVLGAIVLTFVAMGFILRKDKDVARVTTAKVEKIDLVAKVTANGKIQARRKVDLSALVMGQIVNLAARSNAEQARFDYERARRNWESKILSEAEYQKTKSAYDTAQANLSATQQRLQESGANLAASRDSLSKTTVSAPIAGVITYLPVKEGEVTIIGTMNNPGTQLLTVSDMSEVEAVMMVDETSVPEVKVGQKANLTVDAYPGQKFKGIVTEVGSSPIAKNDPDLLSLTQGSEAINFKVKIRVVNPPDTIRPGFSVTADVLTGRKEGATAIPIQALVVRDVPKKDGKPVV